MDKASVKLEGSLSNEELVARIQAGEREHLPQLWEQVERFVRHQATRRAFTLVGAVDGEDLYQSGYLAMVKAIETYSPDEGMQFIGWLAFQLKTAFSEAVGVRTVRQQRDPIHRAKSLDLPIGEEEGATLGDLIPDPSGQSPFQEAEERIWQGELQAAVEKALGELPEAERDTLHRRYWLGQTLAVIGQETGTMPERVRQQEGSALRILRKPRICKPLREFVEERTPYYLHVSATRFNATGTSAVEEIAIRRERMSKK